MMRKLIVAYRLSGSENSAPRPIWYSKQLCLRSFLDSVVNIDFESQKMILLDHSNDLSEELNKELDYACLQGFEVLTSKRTGNCGSYLEALDLVTKDDSDLVLLAEDDYLWSVTAIRSMITAFKEIEAADYITPYDHPARYGLTEDTEDFEHWCKQIFCTSDRHYRPHESTCMTFMVRTEVLCADLKWHRLFSDESRNCPADRKMFRFLQGLGGYNPPIQRLLLGPMPSLATHAHLPFLAPVIDWGAVVGKLARQT